MRAVVLDEADEMLDLCFPRDMEFISEQPSPPHAAVLRRRCQRGIVALAKPIRSRRFASRSRATGRLPISVSRDPIALPIQHAVVNVRASPNPGALVFATRNAGGICRPPCDCCFR